MHVGKDMFLWLSHVLFSSACCSVLWPPSVMRVSENMLLSVCSSLTLCDVPQAERQEERRRQEVETRREQHRQDHLRSERDQVHLELGVVYVV